MESEAPVHEHLAELFERTNPDCVLDVGANVGQYGEMLREHGYAGWIVSFEPVGAVFAELYERVERDPRWCAFNVALGSRTERTTIAVASVSQLSSMRRFNRYGSEEFPGASEVVREEEIQVRTLNDSWNEFLEGIAAERPFLKLDTQGWDLEVLKGADLRLPDLVGLQLEASLTPIYERVPAFAETIEHVNRLGFGLTGVFPVNRDSRLRLIEADCVFVNPEMIEPEETWAMLEERFRRDVAAAVPPGEDLVVIDEGQLDLDQLHGRGAIQFLESGRPESGAQAASELARTGVGHVAFAWPCFWWLDEYPELERELEAGWRRVSATPAAIVYER